MTSLRSPLLSSTTSMVMVMVVMVRIMVMVMMMMRMMMMMMVMMVKMTDCYADDTDDERLSEAIDRKRFLR